MMFTKEIIVFCIIFVERDDSKSIDKFVILVMHALEILYELQMEELKEDLWKSSFV